MIIYDWVEFPWNSWKITLNRHASDRVLKRLLCLKQEKFIGYASDQYYKKKIIEIYFSISVKYKTALLSFTKIIFFKNIKKVNT